jgi:UDPglucose 6-dehydrogenase
MGARIMAACGGNVRGKTIAVFGLTFKPETDDMRDAASIPIIHRLVENGAEIRAFDPAGMTAAKPLLPDHSVTYCVDAPDAATGADAILVLTEWNEFRALSPERLRGLMQGRVVIDLRNIYDPAAMDTAGLDYSSIGRPRNPRSNSAATPEAHTA